LYTLGKVVSDGGEFVLHFLVSRWLGPASYGLFAYAKTLAFSALLLTNLGSDTSILKYLPQHENNPDKRRFLLGLAWLTSFGGGLLVSGSLFVLAPAISEITLAEPRFVGVLRLFAVILFVDTLGNLLYATFRAVELIEYEILSKRLFKPLLRVTGVGIVIILGGTLYDVVVAMAAAGVVTLVVAGYLFLSRLDIRPSLRSPGSTSQTVREYYNYSLPLTLKEAGTLLQGRVDVLMVGLFLSSTAVGIYNVSVLIAGVLYIPLLAVDQLFPPLASKLVAQDKLDDLTQVYSVVTRWVFSLSLPLGLIAVVYRVELLGLFGPEFTAGTLVLMLFVIGQLCLAGTGPSDSLLMMTEHQYIVMANEWVFGLANVALNYVCIQAFGLTGAAIASAGILAVRNLTTVAELKYLEGIQPYSREFRKPLFAGAIAGGWMVAAAGVFSGVTATVIGSVGGLFIYAGGLRLQGIEAVDYLLYQRLTVAHSEDGLQPADD
jgi:O-antigen/teichoic acid export membrane protein